MKTIKGQVIASTQVDSHGEKRSKEELFELFKKMPEKFNLAQNHDLSLPSPGFAENKNFIELPSGEYAIQVDVNLNDDFDISAFGGFSIGFQSHTISNPSLNENFDLLIGVDPRLIDLPEFSKILEFSNINLNFCVSDYNKKGLVSAVFALFEFASEKAFEGFFKEVGSELFRNVKAFFSNPKVIKSNNEIVPEVLINFPVTINNSDIQVVLKVSKDDFLYKDLHTDLAKDFVIEKLKGLSAKRISLKQLDSEPFFKINWIEGPDGKLIE